MKRQSRSPRPIRRSEAQLNHAIAKVSHTLNAKLAERLEEFAFMQRISESSVIEFALHQLFQRGSDARLGDLLRRNGAARRRKNDGSTGR